MMDYIATNQVTSESGLMGKYSRAKDKIKHSFFDNLPSIISAIIILVVIITFIADITIYGSLSWSDVGLTLLILILCSYSMYLTWSVTGTQNGKQTQKYKDVCEKYDKEKDGIISKNNQGRLAEFCKYFTATELKNTRTNILSEVGIEYDVYEKKYMGKDIFDESDLSKTQIKAIRRANRCKMIRLKPEMIMRQGRSNGYKRGILGIDPKTRQGLIDGAQFMSICVTSAIVGSLFINFVSYPTWQTFVMCCLKVLFVLVGGFNGYKRHYDNIAVYTVEYMSDQIDLMQQFDLYIQSNPEKKQETKQKPQKLLTNV